MTEELTEQMIDLYCPPELSDLVSFQIRLAQRAVSRVFNEYMRESGLTHMQYSSLRIIAANGGITQKELALASGTPQTVMVGCLSRLEKAQLIERRRSQSDKRHYHIYLTKPGEKLLKKYRDTSGLAHDALVEGLSDKQIKTLMKALKHIAAK
ncbi:MAG: DNA-binding MarR family transcriptional regulator [Halioglobus sp.]|jgi:DNA-binding MarR family transcriptional regulator